MKLQYKKYCLIILLLSLSFFAFNSGLFTTNPLIYNVSETDSPPVEDTPIPSYAPNWQANGIPICNEDNVQQQLQMCDDGEGGAIIVWIDQRSGSNGEDLYAQRIDSKGNTLWAPNGTVICDFSGDQCAPRLCSDGLGGAIITWYDLRPGVTVSDIYAQRINSIGTIQWDPDGVVICNAMEYQSNPQITSDGVNGAIITWKDGRNSMGFYGDIYAQRINMNGEIQWTLNGVAVCDDSTEQFDPLLCSDGTEGAILTWKDERPNYLYVHRINGSGVSLWIVNVSLDTNTKSLEGIYSDGSNGALIAFIRSDNSRIYVQKIDSSGNRLWGNFGIQVSSQAAPSQGLKLINDGFGGALLTWHRSNVAPYLYDIYAQLVNSIGQIQWGSVGILISHEIRDQYYPQICSDGSGGAIISWQDERDDTTDSDIYDIYFQVIKRDGTIILQENGSGVCKAIDTQYSSHIVSDQNGGAIIAWHDQRDSAISGSDIYATHIGFEIPICDFANIQYNYQVCTDGFGGAIITWEDYRATNYDIYAQRINAMGKNLWTYNGEIICSASLSQNYPHLCSDGAGGAIITWQDPRAGSGNYDIYAQRINSAGEIEWTVNGVVICSAAGSQQYPLIASDGAGGAIITWRDSRPDVNYDIYAQRVNSDGIIQWTLDGVAITSAENTQYLYDIISDDNGGAIIVWEDYRSFNCDIFAQKVNSSGDIQWAVNGTAICTFSNPQHAPQCCSDGQGGAIITWDDYRVGVNSDIYAQRIDSSGIVEWTTNGKAICAAANVQEKVQICSDEQEGAIITWQDKRNSLDYDIYAQRVDLNGDLVWTSNGEAICTESGEQQFPKICNDGGEGTIITWQDNRTEIDSNIYVQRINNNGIQKWEDNGVIISETTDNQDEPEICSCGEGNAFIVWQDYRNGNEDIFAYFLENQAPMSNAPNDIITSEISSDTISWILTDTDGEGKYEVIANDTNNQYYVWQAWTSWTNNTALDVPINRSTIGEFNYTIRYYDDQNKFGIEDSVLVSVMPLPGDFELESDAGIPDDDGEFTLSWDVSLNSNNYSVYESNSYITIIDGGLNLLLEESTDLYLPLTGYTDGTYFFIVVAYNDYGYTLSNCIQIEVRFPEPPGPFTLSSTAESPDDDGTFSLTWTTSDRADNYSVYQYSSYITEINENLTVLAQEISDLSLARIGYINGIYYFICVAHNVNGSTLSNCLSIEVQLNLFPRSFTLSSTAGTPDDDGIFDLSWTSSARANNYSVYLHSSYITVINGDLTLLVEEQNILTLDLSGYSDGTYYFIVVAHNNYGDTLSNCIEIIVQLPKSTQPGIPGYNLWYLIIILSSVVAITVNKNIIKIKKK